MNWYKKLIAGNKPMFTARELLKALRPYGVIVYRQGKGSGVMLINKNNDKVTNMHFHRLGDEMDHKASNRIIHELGIDYHEFLGVSKPKPLPPPVVDNPPKKEEIPLWQNQSWYQKNKQYDNTIASCKDQ